jgi:hypothetical protein
VVHGVGRVSAHNFGSSLLANTRQLSYRRVSWLSTIHRWYIAYLSRLTCFFPASPPPPTLEFLRPRTGNPLLAAPPRPAPEGAEGGLVIFSGAGTDASCSSCPTKLSRLRRRVEVLLLTKPWFRRPALFPAPGPTRLGSAGRAELVLDSRVVVDCVLFMTGCFPAAPDDIVDARDARVGVLGLELKAGERGTMTPRDPGRLGVANSFVGLTAGLRWVVGVEAVLLLLRGVADSRFFSDRSETPKIAGSTGEGVSSLVVCSKGGSACEGSSCGTSSGLGNELPGRICNALDCDRSSLLCRLPSSE